MPNRIVVSVATTPHYQKGWDRLAGAVERQTDVAMLSRNVLNVASGNTDNWPTHERKPYAFKAYALKLAASLDFDTLLWADACMLPVADMTPLFERIERDGYWMSRNGWSNYEWTADSAYQDLFPVLFRDLPRGVALESAREINRNIPHVVATCFGLSMSHPKGKVFLKEYYRLASETDAFCGPWKNLNHLDSVGGVQTPRESVCAPIDVRGHRHDQTAASVIASRLGFVLTDPPEIFAYGKRGEPFDPRTIMIADGSY